jgi:hypothetical protein
MKIIKSFFVKLPGQALVGRVGRPARVIGPACPQCWAGMGYFKPEALLFLKKCFIHFYLFE